MKFQAPRGTQDIFSPAVLAWQSLEATARRVMGRYGYAEIRTPIFESTELFTRGIGEATDIVQKEMYTFSDRKGRSLTLRPEGTAPAVRAYIEHNLGARRMPCRAWYHGPIFRYERPQAGRYRQHHQVGAELLGSPAPEADFEVIDLFVRLLLELGLADVTVRLNSVGDENSRPAFRLVLEEALRPRLSELCEDCRRRFDLNILRIFDCKVPNDRAIVASLPVMIDHLDPASKSHHDRLRSLLDGAGIRYEEDPRLVRGLDYYTRTVFEVHHPKLGAQSAVGGGGRYDNLVSECGGPPTPAVGFSSGIERLLMALEAEGCAQGAVVPPDVMVVGTDRLATAVLAATLRRHHRVDVDLMERSFGSQMKQADRSSARFALILGEDEMAGDFVTLRDMTAGTESRIPRDRLEAELATRLTEPAPNAAPKEQ
ncbi:MAG: histidine--tRNA ligase [Candidatus Eisenbacteria bacterium]|nr:histidine--tRNA ligase [Candidatus Eisenbacteria bacterium]